MGFGTSNFEKPAGNAGGFFTVSMQKPLDTASKITRAHVNAEFTTRGNALTVQPKTVAILAATPALTAVMSMVLAEDTRLRVRAFESEEELFGYMRFAPLDMLVVDFDRQGRPAYEMVEAIRLDAGFFNRDLPVIALTRNITSPMRHQAISAGIDEVLVKPMSPRHLLQRVQARLLGRSVVGLVGSGYRGPDRRDRAPLPKPHSGQNRRAGDNIVPLFPDARKHRHPGLEPRP
jgi:two-component system phosphate regulon response regulator PhoB